MDRIAKLASQKAVVIFSKSTCCMCHAIKRLFYEQGVSPMIHEIDEDSTGKETEYALTRLDSSSAVPAVFIGGKYVGPANTVMTLHLNGSLKKMLMIVEHCGSSRNVTEDQVSLACRSPVINTPKSEYFFFWYCRFFNTISNSIK